MENDHAVGRPRGREQQQLIDGEVVLARSTWSSVEQALATLQRSNLVLGSSQDRVMASSARIAETRRRIVDCRIHQARQA